MKSIIYLIILSISNCFLGLYCEDNLLFNTARDHSCIVLNEKEKFIIAHVKASIENGNNHISQLNDAVLGIHGMSSPKVRHFLNNLCTMNDSHYLEIGCWKGSTFVSSLFNNEKTVLSAIAIDNWSEFYGPKQEFNNNCSTFLQLNKYDFYEADCFQIDLKRIRNKSINIYFYDGNHSELSQELAFTYYNDLFEHVFIAVVDDWNCDWIRLGTYKAFEKLGYTILFETALSSRWNGDIENWWNGLYVAVIRKN